MVGLMTWTDAVFRTVMEGVQVVAVSVLIVYAGMVVSALVSAVAWKKGRPR